MHAEIRLADKTIERGTQILGLLDHMLPHKGKYYIPSAQVYTWPDVTLRELADLIKEPARSLP